MHRLLPHWFVASCAVCSTTFAAADNSECATARLRNVVSAYADIGELRKSFDANSLNVEQLTHALIERIRSCDQSGPTLRSIVEVNPDAIAIAQRLDSNAASLALRGMPIVLKDNIDTADRMMTSVGSLALMQPAGRDAAVVTKLRAAGAIILGKTNVSEWVNFRSRHGISGWSARGGQTRNPYVLDRSPCSSSAGAAVAVAAGFAVAAIGTETDGSILCPASFNGIVGIKPTMGLVSRTGVVPLAHSQDTIGPMARTVTDAVTVLNAIVGSDRNDPATAQADRYVSDFRRALNVDGLKGKRIGVLRQFMGAEPNADRILEQALEVMKTHGATIVDSVVIPHADELPALKGVVLRYEFKHNIDRYLAARPNLAVKNLADVIAFNKREAAREMPWFGQELLEQTQSKGPLTDAVYVDALAKAKLLSGPEGIDAALTAHKLDALIAPSWGPAFVVDPVYGDPDIPGPSTPAAVAGYPSITVPAGFAHELPVGVILIGTAWNDATLISIAYSYEQHSKAWRAPRFLNSVQ